ncbi:hypothetical protein [Duganella sp. Root1480D1]|uniref:hypothetical protein n=1 Tax=Duganella sp. Root1480D1 TaxID=1736471 RepID=UPI000B0C74F9|nr:hypothetical protein [Duganella sp. Root1480D1]
MSAAMLISRTGPRLGIKVLVVGALLVGNLGSVYAEATAPTLIGHYSNQVWTRDVDPHAISGYALDLYKQGDVVFGSIGVAVGSPEPVGAKLYDILYDEKSKTLSFKAKYSEGTQYGKDIPPEKREAKVILTFSGKLNSHGAQGEIVRQDGYPPFATIEKKRSLLRKQSSKYVPHDVERWNKRFVD